MLLRKFDLIEQNKPVMKKIVLLLFVLLNLQTSAQSYCNAGPTSFVDSEITGITLVGHSQTISNQDKSCGPIGVQDLTGTYSADLFRDSSYSIDIEMGTCGQLLRGYSRLDRF